MWRCADVWSFVLQTRRLIETVYADWGLKHASVDMRDLNNLVTALQTAQQAVASTGGTIAVFVEVRSLYRLSIILPVGGPS